MRPGPARRMILVPQSGGLTEEQEGIMGAEAGTTTVAKVIEITSTSKESFEDAVRRGIGKATESVHGIQGAWVKEQKVIVEDGVVVGFRVDLKLTFVLD